jgi:hypothetical protein
MIARAIRLLLAGGFLAAVAHVAPVAERAALGVTRVEDLAPEAIARPLGKIRAACRIDRLSHQLESPSESGDASKCGDLSSADDMRDAAVEQFIEERRQQALAMIEKMREPDDA